VHPEGLPSEMASAFERVLAATHLTRPSDVATELVRNVAPLGAEDVVFYVPDYAQEVLVPLPAEKSPERTEQSIEGTMIGRSYTTTSILQAPMPTQRDRIRVWIPLLDGTDRVGAVEMTLPGVEGEVSMMLLAACERYAHFASQLIVLKSAYGDTIERLRRRKPMSVAAQLVWRLLPPLTFATHDLVISGVAEPAYELGGDAFDYAVNGKTAHVAVLDGMGHGLTAAALTSFAISAYRQSRIAGHSLTESYTEMYSAISETFGGDRYVTALLLELDLDNGKVRWLSAGHPAPLLLRQGRVVKTLEAEAAFPLGLPLAPEVPPVAEESLEPGDRILLYTDGFPEARLPNGELFGMERLAGFLEREAAAGQSAPETLRRLRRVLLDELDSQLRDDATAVLVSWRGGGERALLPQTAR
jgi:hypothetical protein